MRKLVWGALGLALCFVSCGRNAFTIDGKLTVEDGSEVYLIDQVAGDTLGVTAVIGNTFAFAGKLQEPMFVYVGRGRERVRFVLEPGTVQVDLDERTVSGTPMVDDYVVFNQRFYSFDREKTPENKALQVELADSMYRASQNWILKAVVLDDLALKDTSRFLALYRDADQRIKDFFMVKADYASITVANATGVGKLFTDYTVQGGNPDGTDVKLSDYVGQGKFILLDHWASWCGPCKAEMPYLKKTYEAFHGDRFDIVGVAVSDKRADTEKAILDWDLPWNQILDAQRLPIDLYGVNAIPHLILFAPDGKILARGLRGEDIYAAVEAALQQ
jgi:thiol-disulfide isomerase/thioredoxin